MFVFGRNVAKSSKTPNVLWINTRSLDVGKTVYDAEWAI